MPDAIRRHEERNVFRVVVVIADDRIEDHSTEQLRFFGGKQFQLFHRVESQLIGIRHGIVVIHVPHRAEGLHVEFFPVHPVKAFGHEVSAIVIFQQTAFAHLDSGSLRHEVIRILDTTVGTTTISAGSSKSRKNEAHTMTRTILTVSLLLLTALAFCTERETIRDSSGKVVGTATTDGNKTVYRDAHGKVTGISFAIDNISRLIKKAIPFPGRNEIPRTWVMACRRHRRGIRAPAQADIPGNRRSHQIHYERDADAGRLHDHAHHYGQQET